MAPTGHEVAFTTFPQALPAPGSGAAVAGPSGQRTHHRTTIIIVHAHFVSADATLERLPVAVIRFDRAGRVLYANARAADITGRFSGLAIGCTPADFPIAPSAARAWATVLDEVGATGVPGRFDIRVRTAESDRWFEAAIVPERALDGTVTALVTAYDTTAHHEAAARLEASEVRFRRLAEGSQDLISQHDGGGLFLYASPGASRLLGRQAGSLTGVRFGELVHPEDRDTVEAALAAALAGEEPMPAAFRVAHPDGRIVECEMTAHVADPGERGEPSVICITRDISERVRAERILREASRLEGTATLAAGVAHDFNNLMTGILGNAEVLLADPAGPDVPARLSRIASAAKRGGALAQQLLAYGRGGRERSGPVDLNAVVHQALYLHRHAVPPTIELEETLEPELPPVDGDAVQLGQVVTNLCINAAEAVTGRGRVTIATRRVHLDAAAVASMPGMATGPCVVLEVSDTGGGIPPEVLPRVFEPFFSTKAAGRGLGLAAASGIVKSHRGHIAVETEVGQGTRFAIHLPVSSASVRPSPPPRAGLPTGTETVLLIDDDPAVVDVTRVILERLRYRVLVAHRGAEAVEIARRHRGPIDLAMLDMAMPIAGGGEIFPLLKAARPHLRVVILTGYALNDAIEAVLAAGADAFLQKPYRVTALANGIRGVLDGEIRGRLPDD